MPWHVHYQHGTALPRLLYKVTGESAKHTLTPCEAAPEGSPPQAGPKILQDTLLILTNESPHLRLGIHQVLDGDGGVFSEANVGHHPKDSPPQADPKILQDNLLILTNESPHLRLGIHQVLDGDGGVFSEANVGHHPKDKGVGAGPQGGGRGEVELLAVPIGAVANPVVVNSAGSQIGQGDMVKKRRGVVEIGVGIAPAEQGALNMVNNTTTSAQHPQHSILSTVPCAQCPNHIVSAQHPYAQHPHAQHPHAQHPHAQHPQVHAKHTQHSIHMHKPTLVQR